MTVSFQGTRGRTTSSSSQLNEGSITIDFGIAGAESDVSSSSRSASPGTYGRTFAACQSTAPSIAFAYGIDQELRGVEALAGVRVVRAVHAVPVALPWPDAGQVAVPVERRALLDVDPLLVPVPVVQAELDALGVLREEREVRALAVPLRPERERLTGPHGSHLSSTVVASKSATSVRSPRRSVRTLPWASTSSSLGSVRRSSSSSR